VLRGPLRAVPGGIHPSRAGGGARRGSRTRAEAPPGAGFGGENICKAEEGGRISCWNWGSDGTFSPGEFLADGDVFRYPLARKAGSTAPEQRMTWKRLDADSVRVSREKKEGEAWTESFAVVYTRVRP
jgi:hypothetical protein